MEEFIVKGLYEDDYGCEERFENEETMILEQSSGEKSEIKEADRVIFVSKSRLIKI